MDHIGTCTYSPEDNKIRITPYQRLDKDVYLRVKAAGFIWAPQQKIFVAPMWTPEREDLAIELCGEIGDEDTSLVERAEERAGRFEEYRENRKADAEQAHAGVERITSGIPLGQPILIGHHSEKHARKDQERIENGMRKAVKMWETAEYWKHRAAGALAHAKYKENPAVRARRIKGLEADKRKQERNKAEAELKLKLWSQPDLTVEKARTVSNTANVHLPRKEGDKPDFNQCPDANSCLSGENGNNYYPSLYAPRTLEEIITAAKRTYPRQIAYASRWLSHFENRLTYEKAMLEDQGASDLIAPTKRPAQLPLLNYRQDTFQAPKMYHRGEFETLPQLEMTTAEYQKIYKDRRGTRIIGRANHRVRMAMVDLQKYPQFRTAADDAHAKQYGEKCVRRYQDVIVFLTDSKVHPKPEPAGPAPEPEYREPAIVMPAYRPHQEKSEEQQKIETLREQIKAGVKVVTATSLFPTPPELAKRMFELADIHPGECVLEPSAGTGNLIKAVLDRVDTEVLAYEINRDLSDMLYRLYPSYKLQVRNKDFLEVTDFQGCYPKILMNPPFENKQDIRHVRHAFTFLKPGGRLVAVMSSGVTFRSDKETAEFRHWLEEIGATIEPLPAETFKESGTSVNTCLVVIDRPQETREAQPEEEKATPGPVIPATPKTQMALFG